MANLDLLPSAEDEAALAPTAAEVRERIEAVFARLADGDCAPREVALWRLIVPPMADWLEPAERDAARQKFSRLVEALGTPLAAG